MEGGGQMGDAVVVGPVLQEAVGVSQSPLVRILVVPLVGRRGAGAGREVGHVAGVPLGGGGRGGARNGRGRSLKRSEFVGVKEFTHPLTPHSGWEGEASGAATQGRISPRSA